LRNLCFWLHPSDSFGRGFSTSFARAISFEAVGVSFAHTIHCSWAIAPGTEQSSITQWVTAQKSDRPVSPLKWVSSVEIAVPGKPRTNGSEECCDGFAGSLREHRAFQLK